MSSSACVHCHRPLSSSLYTYCDECKGKIRSGEIKVPRHVRWYYRHPELARQRSTKPKPEQRREYNTAYVQKRRMQTRRENRYAFITQERNQSNIICFWCGEMIPLRRIKKCRRDAPPKFCCRICAAADLKELNTLTGFYQRVLSKAGNEKLATIEQQTGERPGSEKRREHARRLHEARKNGKLWKKTGPSKKVQ